MDSEHISESLSRTYVHLTPNAVDDGIARAAYMAHCCVVHADGRRQHVMPVRWEKGRDWSNVGLFKPCTVAF
jgi:hypothetical protein